MKKLLLIILIPFNLLAQQYKELPYYKPKYNELEIQSGSCASPDGIDKQTPITPPDYNYLLTNGYCGYTYPTTSTFTACFNFTTPSSSVDVNAGFSSSCNVITITFSRLFDNTCTLVGNGFSFTGLTVGQTYTWCIRIRANGGGGCNGFDTFCPYYLNTSPMPLEWSPIEAKLDGTIVYINWKTYSEQNTDYFQVQRTNDTIFADLDYPLLAAYYSSNIVEYSYKDFKPLLDISYYRVKQVDKDGKHNYSNIVTIDNKQYKVFRITVYNVLGQIVSDSMNNLPQGVYIVQYETNKGLILNKIYK
jgi:hypothetical protein